MPMLQTSWSYHLWYPSSHFYLRHQFVGSQEYSDNEKIPARQCLRDELDTEDSRSNYSFLPTSFIGLSTLLFWCTVGIPMKKLTHWRRLIWYSEVSGRLVCWHTRKNRRIRRKDQFISVLLWRFYWRLVVVEDLLISILGISIFGELSLR